MARGDSEIAFSTAVYARRVLRLSVQNRLTSFSSDSVTPLSLLGQFVVVNDVGLIIGFESAQAYHRWMLSTFI